MEDKNETSQRIISIVGVVAVIIIVAALAFSQNGKTFGAKPTSQIQVVAAENFWGSMVSQLCGVHCNVTSIVSDPNADPHQYEASASTARLISNAKFVIVNGVGYDDWALRLLSASNSPNRTVLNAGQLLNIQNGSNPHLWYDLNYVNATVKQMYNDLIKIDPSNASYYAQQYTNMTSSLKQLYNRESIIRQQFAGTKVAATEDIFVYMANATRLNLVSPLAFMQAVAEGNDPPVQSVTIFQNQLSSGNVRVLVYNVQTVTPLTQQMKQIAVQHNVTIVGVSETIQPPDVSFQNWMSSELQNLQNALNANALGQ